MKQQSKRILALLVSLCLLMSMMPAMVIGAAAAGTTTIYYDNSGSNWSNVYVYTWNSNGDCTGSWPGVAMTHVEGSIYSYDVPADAVNIIFNANDGNQTTDLTIPTDGKNLFNGSSWSVYGAEVSYMTPEVVAEYLAKVTDEEIDAEMALEKTKYNVEVTYHEEHKLATKSGLAIRKWMEEKGLGSVTVNFLTLDICGLPKMPFPECCKVLERGLGYAGEGDVLTAGLVGAMHAIYPNSTFTEMFCPDWEQDVILMSHMGESNPNLAQWKPYIRDCNFSYNSCGNTVGMYSCGRKGNATIVNLAPMNEGYNLILCPGKMLDVGLERGAYATSTQGWFKPAKPLNKFLKEYSLAGGTHHSAMVYDVDIEELKAFGQMMGFNVIVVE